MNPIRILLIEDSFTDALLIESFLAGEKSFNHTLTRADRLADGLAQMSRQKFDVVLTDLALPDSQGLKTFEELHKRAAHLPIVVLTRHDDNDLALKAIKMGAQDYLPKDNFESLLLVRTINYAIERKETELALRESEERFRRSFDDAPIGLALVSLEGRWLRVNRALCEIVGYGEAELLATDFQTITHPEDLQADLNFVHSLIAGKIRDYKMEKRYFHIHGHIVHVLLSVSLVRDSGGEPLYFVSQIQDITGRKQREAEREKLIAELQAALAQVKTLSGLLPICSSCKKVRDDKGYWNQIESYIRQHSDATFTHS